MVPDFTDAIGQIFHSVVSGFTGSAMGTIVIACVVSFGAILMLRDR